jgi:molybdopterin synthase sulfur carrier subunit
MTPDQSARPSPEAGTDAVVQADPGPRESAAAWVTVRYWAGARHAAGVAEEPHRASTIGELGEVVVAARPALEPVLPACSVLVDGRAREAAFVLRDGQVVEFLPPFAGG